MRIVRSSVGGYGVSDLALSFRLWLTNVTSNQATKPKINSTKLELTSPSSERVSSAPIASQVLTSPSTAKFRKNRCHKLQWPKAFCSCSCRGSEVWPDNCSRGLESTRTSATRHSPARPPAGQMCMNIRHDERRKNGKEPACPLYIYIRHRRDTRQLLYDQNVRDFCLMADGRPGGQCEHMYRT